MKVNYLIRMCSLYLYYVTRSYHRASKGMQIETPKIPGGNIRGRIHKYWPLNINVPYFFNPN